MKSFLVNNWDKLFLLLVSLLVIYPLFFPGYFSHHDDLQVIRIFEMKSCILDGQIPCRWSANMGYGYGLPIFNYYNPLPYYVGGAVSFILGYVKSAKLLFFVPLFFSGFTFYLLAKALLNKRAALAGATLYALVPYRAIDSYVRGAIGESFSILLAPLILYFVLRLAENNTKKYFLGLSLSLFAFLTSHTVSILIWAPVFIIWFSLVLFLKRTKNLKSIVLAVFLGAGLASFFILPAFFEKDLITDFYLISGDLDFRNHFVSIGQLFFDRFWGYGSSVFGLGDGLSFQVGFPHWILGALSLIFMLLIPKKTTKNDKGVFIFLLLIFLFSIFMAHNKSSFIWESLDILKYIQFPWRYLSVGILTISLLGAFLVKFFKGFWSTFLLVCILVLTALLNLSYFRPENYYFDVNDETKLQGSEYELQIKGSALDYLPITARPPTNIAGINPEVVSGVVEWQAFTKNSHSWVYEAGITEEALVKFPVFQFPGWRVELDGKKVDHGSSDDGLINLKIPAGEHIIKARFKNTFIRSFSNVVSIVSLFGLLIIIKYDKKIFSR